VRPLYHLYKINYSLYWRILIYEHASQCGFLIMVLLHTSLPMSGLWIRRGGPQEWPPASPDMNLILFFAWRRVKNPVYQGQGVQTEEELWERFETLSGIRAKPEVSE
jgi:hypothetical protein